MQTKNQTFGDSMKAFILALFTFLSIDMAFSQPVPSEAQYQLNQNKLLNPGFEQGRRGWTSAAGTLTATAANGVDDGVNAGCVTLSSQTLNVHQIIPVGNLRGQGEVSTEAYATVAGAQVCSVVDNVDVNCSPVENLSAWRNRKEIGFVAGTTNYGIRYRTSAPVTGTFCLDSAYAGKMPTGRVSEVGAIGPWISYTPTFTGFGTVSSVQAYYRLVGSNIELNVRFTTGTTTGVTAQVTLPSGFLSSSGDASLKRVGTARVPNTASSPFLSSTSVLTQDGRNYVSFEAPTSVSLIEMAGTAASSSQVFIFNASVPIAGLNSRVSLYSQQCRKPSDCENVFSAKVSAAGVVSDENLDWINGNCGLSGNRFSCTFNSSIFTTPPTCTITAQGTATVVTAQESTVITSSVLTYDTVSGGVGTAVPARIICTKAAPDYKERNMITGTFEDVVTSPGSSRSSLCSAKVSSSGVLSDQIGGCFTSCTNAATPVCTFTVGYWRAGTTPNCWHRTSSAGLLWAGTTTTTTFGALVVNTGFSEISANREYFCTGLR
jgi:hypothetical protein